MENYEVLSIAGEGSYGVVMKCRHTSSNRIVAVKKMTDFGNDDYVRKIILREVRILKKLRHENLVQLIEFFKKKKRFYLVFEYLERTVLDDIENHTSGLDERQTLKYIYQTIRAVEFCHRKNIIHRDIKPENLLISNIGILKLCDFGCARVLSSSKQVNYTEYVATRWYRAPELLVRDKQYGKEVDIWAIGCVLAEMLTGYPLFPGQSDVDQLYMITKLFGKLCSRHQQFLNSGHFDFYHEVKIGDQENSMNNFHALHNMFPSWSIGNLHIVASCLHLDPVKRPTAHELLNNNYFVEKNVGESWFKSLLERSIDSEARTVINEFSIKCDSQSNRNQSTLHHFTDIEICSKKDDDFAIVGKHPTSNNSNAKMKSSNQKCRSTTLLTPMTSGKIIPITEFYRQVNTNHNFWPRKGFTNITNGKFSAIHDPQSSFNFNQLESPSIKKYNNKHKITTKYNISQRDEFKPEDCSKTKEHNTLENKYYSSSVHDMNLPSLEITGRSKITVSVGKMSSNIGC